jgi:HEAT repeat protein
MWSSLLFFVAVSGTPTLGERDVASEIDALVSAWRTTPDASTEELCQGLVELGHKAVPTLCGLLDEHRDNAPVDPIAAALGRLGRVSAVESLLGLLESARTDHRVSAVSALSALNAPECETGLLTALDDSESEVHSRAASGLATLAEGTAASNVVRGLGKWILSAKYKDRYAIVLGGLADPAARESLHELLYWYDARTKMAALSGLWREARAEDGKPVYELLTDSDSVAVKKKAVLLLGRIGYRPAARDLIDLLRSPNAGLVANAHWALREMTGLRLAPDIEMWELWWEKVGK